MPQNFETQKSDEEESSTSPRCHEINSFFDTVSLRRIIYDFATHNIVCNVHKINLSGKSHLLQTLLGLNWRFESYYKKVLTQIH